MINIWDNPANYKKCTKKQYEIWVCQPPEGTVIINKLEQADAVQYAGGRTYFTTKVLKSDAKAQAIANQLLQAGKAYLVKDNQTFVLCGTQGEMWCISGQKLAQKYVWAADGSPIDAQSYNAKLKFPRDWVVTDPKTGKMEKKHHPGYLPWTKVRTVPDNSTAFACYVPANMRGQIQTSWAILNINGPGVNHGLGDFVIAANANGQPNLANRYVVNGAVFADTYDNRGWTDKLAQGYNAVSLDENSLPQLLPYQSSTSVPVQKDPERFFAMLKAYSDKHPDMLKYAKLCAAHANKPADFARRAAAATDADVIAIAKQLGPNYNGFIIFKDLSAYRVVQRLVPKGNQYVEEVVLTLAAESLTDVNARDLFGARLWEIIARNPTWRGQSKSISSERQMQLLDNMIEYLQNYSDDIDLDRLGIYENTPSGFRNAISYIRELVGGSQGRSFYMQTLGFTKEECDLLRL